MVILPLVWGQNSKEGKIKDKNVLGRLETERRQKKKHTQGL